MTLGSPFLFSSRAYSRFRQIGYREEALRLVEDGVMWLCLSLEGRQFDWDGGSNGEGFASAILRTRAAASIETAHCESRLKRHKHSRSPPFVTGATVSHDAGFPFPLLLARIQPLSPNRLPRRGPPPCPRCHDDLLALPKVLPAMRVATAVEDGVMWLCLSLEGRQFDWDGGSNGSLTTTNPHIPMSRQYAIGRNSQDLDFPKSGPKPKRPPLSGTTPSQFSPQLHFHLSAEPTGVPECRSAKSGPKPKRPPLSGTTPSQFSPQLHFHLSAEPTGVPECRSAVNCR
ncbi:hypothetical protein LR48_Vigan316s002100 [Vigna angularis]|uniref:Uncharacterized protein n=1 Tax=Phaseolus angularis TaxID=3914 RepID=A0A0L9T9K0_PHAAN|nr:hypothetical protein LR48_Vigan316s002100 [Vigna angularis]